MHYDSYVPNLSAFHESSIYDDLSKKSKQYYEEYTPEYYTIEEGEIKKNFEEKTKKTIHGVKHYEAVRFLSEKLSEIFNIPKDNFGFVKLLAMYHDASRLHEREDKEELPNGEMFYRDASEFNIPENEKILGGLLISLKGELSNIMADKNKEQTTEIIKQFLEGVEKPLNGITITKKTSDISADEWYLLIKEHFINHLSALNLADTIDVVRVRFAKEEDAKITEKEIAKHKLNFFETGELNLKMVLKKVPNNTLINTKSEAEYKVRNLIKTHFTRVIEDEKRYFPEFRRYEIKFKDFKQEITNHIKDYPEKETKLIEEFLKNMTGQNTKELESLENFMQSYENKAMEEAQKKQNQLLQKKPSAKKVIPVALNLEINKNYPAQTLKTVSEVNIGNVAPSNDPKNVAKINNPQNESNKLKEVFNEMRDAILNSKKEEEKYNENQKNIMKIQTL